MNEKIIILSLIATMTASVCAIFGLAVFKLISEFSSKEKKENPYHWVEMQNNLIWKTLIIFIMGVILFIITLWFSSDLEVCNCPSEKEVILNYLKNH